MRDVIGLAGDVEMHAAPAEARLVADLAGRRKDEFTGRNARAAAELAERDEGVEKARTAAGEDGDFFRSEDDAIGIVGHRFPPCPAGDAARPAEDRRIGREKPAGEPEAVAKAALASSGPSTSDSAPGLALTGNLGRAREGQERHRRRTCGTFGPWCRIDQRFAGPALLRIGVVATDSSRPSSRMR